MADKEKDMHMNYDLYTSGHFWRVKNRIGTQPSAPLDTAKFNIRVEWSAPFPERWRVTLHKALQRWFSSSLPKDNKEKYNIVHLQLLPDQNYAEVEVEPSTALDIVKEAKTATLTFRELNQNAVVHFLLDNIKPGNVPLKQEPPVDKKKGFMPQVDMFVCSIIDLDRWSQEVQTELLKRMGQYKTGNKLSFYGSLVEVERFCKEVCEIIGGSEAEMDTDAVRNDPSVEIPQNSGPSGAPPAFITPLHQYWYFSHAYKKEINQIQDKFGVKIDAEVSVSVTAEDQTRPDSVRKAKDKLMDLYQTSTTSLQSVLIPKTQLDSDTVKNVVRNIQSDQAKMALMMSVDGCMLSGPKNTVSGVQSRLNSEESGEVASRQMSRTSELKTDPILMNETHWRLMKKRFEKHLLNIEQKYGVRFCDEHSHGSAKVTIQSRENQAVNHESHALKDFMQLYLEVVLSAVSVPEQERTVVEALERHRLVGVEDKNAEQSDPAYQSMDRDPGFDDEPKKLFNTEYLPFQKQPEKSYGMLTGNQPEGEMKYSTLRYDLPGYPRCGTIEIIYDIPSGIQTDEHPNPGHPFSGIKCRAYLPDSPEGRQVLHLLIRAFDQRLIFTVGTSTTTGAQNTVIWNDIHHKTNTTGGPEGNGYPDSNYMKRVKEELKAKGIEFPV